MANRLLPGFTELSLPNRIPGIPGEASGAILGVLQQIGKRYAEQTEQLFRAFGGVELHTDALELRDATARVYSGSEGLTARANQFLRISPPPTGFPLLLPSPLRTVPGDRVTISLEAPSGALRVSCVPNQGSDRQVTTGLVNGVSRATFTQPGKLEFVSNGATAWLCATELPAESLAATTIVQLAAAGVTGATGAQGIQGQRGFPGEQGDPGEEGPRGFPGQNGSAGATGATGATGPSGATGLQPFCFEADRAEEPGEFIPRGFGNALRANPRSGGAGLFMDVGDLITCGLEYPGVSNAQIASGSALLRIRGAAAVQFIGDTSAQISGSSGASSLTFTSAATLVTGSTNRLVIDSNGEWTTPAGASGQVLTHQGAGTPPIWSTPAASSAAARDPLLALLTTEPPAEEPDQFVPRNLAGEVVGQVGNFATVTRSTDFASTPWTGNHQFNGTVGLFGVLSHAAWAAQQDDLAIGNVNVVRGGSTGNQTLTGMIPAVAGQLVLIENTDTIDWLTIAASNAGSAVANRFKLPDNLDLRLPPNGTALFRHDPASSGWFLASPPANGRLLQVTQYTTGAAATHTWHSGAKTAIIDIVSSGGGGASVANPAAAQCTMGSGGGSGVWVRALWNIDTATLTYTVGAGAAGNASGNASSVTDGTDTISCPGGSVGVAVASGTTNTWQNGGSSVTAPTLTGSGTGFTVLNGASASMFPGDGGEAFRVSGTLARSGNGSPSPMGGGLASGRVTTGTGITGKAPGAGGGGALSFNAGGAQTGGASLAGFITIAEYS